MTDLSPFTTNRFEYEHKQIYYLHKEIFGIVEEPKPTYLVGSRGTGKTTILKALNWAERIGNQSLKNQLCDQPFKSEYLGVYLKLPETAFGLLDDWLKRESQLIYGNTLGLYLDLMWIELVADAMAELVVRGLLSFTPKMENSFVLFIKEEYPDALTQYLSQRGPYTLKDFSKAIKQVKRSLVSFATGRAS